jgi:Encapsulating protein for peroxidase
MNNLHRELAPVSQAAWAQIEEETARTFKRYLAGRRVVDVRGPAGVDLPAVGEFLLNSIARRSTTSNAAPTTRIGSQRRTQLARLPLPRTARFLRAIAQPASWEFVRGQAIRRCPFRPTFAGTRMPSRKP